MIDKSRETGSTQLFESLLEKKKKKEEKIKNNK